MPRITIPVPFTKTKDSEHPQGAKRFDGFRLSWNEAYVEALSEAIDKLDVTTEKKIAKLRTKREERTYRYDKLREKKYAKIEAIHSRSAETLRQHSSNGVVVPVVAVPVG